MKNKVKTKNKSILKNTMIIVMLIIISVSITFGVLYGIEKSSPNPGGNAGTINDVMPGKLVSEKYGTYDIPNNNMYVTFGQSFVRGELYFKNGTNLTYIKESVYDELQVKYPNNDVKNEYTTLFYCRDNNYDFSKDATAEIWTNGSSKLFNFSDNVFKFDQSLNTNNSINKYIKLGMEVYNNKNLDLFYKKVNDNASALLLSLDLRVLGQKVTITTGSESYEIIIPVVLTSDKGHVLTEKIYNEIRTTNDSII